MLVFLDGTAQIEAEVRSIFGRVTGLQPFVTMTIFVESFQYILRLYQLTLYFRTSLSTTCLFVWLFVILFLSQSYL